jgi:hypothetical protein
MAPIPGARGTASPGTPYCRGKWATVKIVQHVTDDTLERYAMQTLPESELGSPEEHILICFECRERLQAEIDFVAAMQGAAARIRELGTS